MVSQWVEKRSWHECEAEHSWGGENKRKRRGRISNGLKPTDYIAMEILRWEKKGIIILQLLRRVSRIENAFHNPSPRALFGRWRVNGIMAGPVATNRSLFVSFLISNLTRSANIFNLTLDSTIHPSFPPFLNIYIKGVPKLTRDLN